MWLVDVCLAEQRSRTDLWLITSTMTHSFPLSTPSATNATRPTSTKRLNTYRPTYKSAVVQLACHKELSPLFSPGEDCFSSPTRQELKTHARNSFHVTQNRRTRVNDSSTCAYPEETLKPKADRVCLSVTAAVRAGGGGSLYVD